MDIARRLPGIAARLSEKSRANRLSVANLRRECPWLCSQIEQDAATRGLFDFWSLSSNFDELACESIVEPGVLAVMGEIAGLPMVDPVVHAGLQHTYGYLLSTILTRYGYKRDRWTSPHIEQGFGLPTDVLSPQPAQGTLLANATFLSGCIAFREDEAALRQLRRLRSAVAPSLAQINFQQLDQTRVIELMAFRDRTGRFSSLRIQTDLVPFPHRVSGSDERYLLVYSLHDSRDERRRLTTLFPVTQAFFDEMTRPERFGPRVEMRLRFNGVVQDLPGATFTGRRTLKRLKCPIRK